MLDLAAIASLAVAGWSYMASTTIGGAMIGGLAGGHIGNAVDRAACAIGRSIRDRLAGLRSLPDNHDLAAAVRTAQMQALERVLRTFRDAAHDGKAGASKPYHDFFTRAFRFCGPTGSGRKSEVEATLEITTQLQHAFDRLLGEPLYGSPAGECCAAIAAFAEDAVLTELRAVVGDVIEPPDFEKQFRDGNGAKLPRFLDVFGFYLAEQIKIRPRVRDIMLVGQLARIEGLAFDGSEVLEKILTEFGGIGHRLEAVEEISRQTAQTADNISATATRTELAITTLPDVVVAKLLAVFAARQQDTDFERCQTGRSVPITANPPTAVLGSNCRNRSHGRVDVGIGHRHVGHRIWRAGVGEDHLDPRNRV